METNCFQCYSFSVNKFLEIVLTASLIAATSAAAERSQAPKVIVIGVDGLSVEGVSKGHVPNLKRLMEHSAWTLSARGVLPTLSSPNWESMITGAGTEQHGITSNGMLHNKVEFKPVCQGAEGKFPTIFDALRAQHPQANIAIFHDWRGFADLVARNSADVVQHESGPARTTEAAIAYWKQHRPELLFMHLDNVDHTGHAFGWGSGEYRRSVTEADRHIGEIVRMLDEESAWDSTFVLVTSDHGGTPRGHGRNSLAEIQIPWILAGPRILAGEIASLVNTFDTAATLAWIFKLEPLQCAIGRPVVAAFQPVPVLLTSTQTNE